ncbi:MAG: excinuclease ABC subunit UvrC [Chromatiales bacterium]|nr:excinuclease ABC subunit UvrC [Chromatiales bacterium]
MDSKFDAKEFIAALPHVSGTYQMLNADGERLYVGKAKDLKKRIASYFRKHGLSYKTKSMVNQIANIHITVTRTEAEALLLENNLIKKYKPRYNVLLRDDKSYPYIYISDAEEFPRIAFYRGARNSNEQYYGPYPSVSAVRLTLNLLQKLFKLRTCRPSYFKNRTRPCLQYQIKRCSAPCVGYISQQNYRKELSYAVQFLKGNSRSLIESLINRMDKAAQSLNYEEAAHYRDQVATLRQVSDQQLITGDGGDTDIIAANIKETHACVQVFNIRGGMNIGNKAFYPTLPNNDIDIVRLLTTFAGQYYLRHPIPNEIIFSHQPDDQETLAAMLSDKSNRKVKLLSRAIHGKKKKYLELAIKNADIALQAKLLSRTGMHKRLQSMQEALNLSKLPTRMECFDVSHTMGEKTIAACVVFDQNGALKQDYRRFNINDITGGDDYAAMRQVLKRRYTRVKSEGGKIPDVLFVDGGKGQTSEAQRVLAELGLADVTIIGIAKGAERKPGLETLINGELNIEMKLQPDSPALHLIQQIRDEAHRFAIGGHRRKRDKARRRSMLEDIAGLGAKRRQSLLRYFGGLQGVNKASVEELKKVPGISLKIAESVYRTLHEEYVK